MPSDTPSPRAADVALGREPTPDLRNDKHSRRHESERPEGDDEERRDRDRHREDRAHRRRHGYEEDEDVDRDSRRKRSERDEETPEEREERRRRRREEETDEEREERRRRRKERERERERLEREPEDEGERRRHRSRRDRSGSRESHKSLRSHRSHRSSARDVDPDHERRTRDRETEDRRRYDDRDRRPRDRYDDRRSNGYRASPMRPPSPPRRRRSPNYEAPPPRPPPPPRDEATVLLEEAASEARSVFVSQLAAKLTSRDLGMFFEDKLGARSVRDARVVTDRITRRSKGIAYVELASVDLVSQAISLTGTIVMGLPIMVTLTESERNNQGMSSMPAIPGAPMSGPGSLPPLRPNIPGLPPGLNKDANGEAEIPYYRLYVGNLYYNLTADDIKQVFEPFGELAFVDLPMEPATNRSRGYAFVQYKELEPAKIALASMNGFELAGRQIKVSTVHEKGTAGQIRAPVEQLEDNPGYGTRMDASARQQLMYKLARQPDPSVPGNLTSTTPTANRLNIPAQQTSFVQLSNMFTDADAAAGGAWDLDLAEDIKDEVESKYGSVDKLVVDKNSKGDVYLKFANIDGAAKGVQGLNGRMFAGQRVVAKFISEPVFKAHV